LNDGFLPNPDSVRVEEFINYFKQDYEPPADDVFAIHIEGAPSAFGSEKHWLMRVGLQGKLIETADRDDASLVFVIDVSGSMSREDRLGLVKESLGLLVDELRADDKVGIVIYGSQAKMLLEPTAGDNKGAIMEAIHSLRSEGSTNAADGLRMGYQMAQGLIGPGRTTRVVLLSDGVANVGNTGSESILNDIRGYVDQGIQLSTIGFGMGNYNDILMEQLANDGDGNYAYVDTINQAKRVFVENLTGMLQVIAKDVKVQVDFDPNVVSRYRLIGYENRRVADRDFRNDEVDAGEVGAGHSVTALYEVKLREDASGQMANVFLRYEDPKTGEVTEINQGFDMSQLLASANDASARFQLDSAVAEYAELLRESYWAQDGNLNDVKALVQRVTGMLPDDPDVSEFAALVDRALGISG
jgi:Ca-activated chloride channel family protein